MEQEQQEPIYQHLKRVGEGLYEYKGTRIPEGVTFDELGEWIKKNCDT